MSEVLLRLGQWLHFVFLEQFSGWVLVGYVAQLCFSMRFILQWIASEKAGRSVMPVAFWLFSILGGGLLLIYAIYRNDPVFILGQGLGLLIYARNLWLIRNERKSAAARERARGISG